MIDLASPRAVWRIPHARVVEIKNALGVAWDVAEVKAPAVSDGDGGSGSPEAIAAARGAEIYLGYGVPSGIAAAGKGTLRWAHTATAGVGSSLAHLAGTGVVLTNSAGVHADPMADWVIAAIAYFTRGLDRMISAQRQGRWAKEDFTDGAIPMRELRSLRVGIVGLEGIGTTVVVLAVLAGLGRVEKLVERQSMRSTITVHAHPGPTVLEDLEGLVRRAGLEVSAVASRQENVDLVIDFDLRGSKRLHDQLMITLLHHDHVRTVSTGE
ncbi:MAG: hypothetical protein AUI86_03700 [Gemmatimonadetes bacterium 13_1_40CM_3_66_12]|nr:MAG: hypothetical protein AUI86_03700 [Gemmatimonadetes bacterium 13_1_40CM_3_66_12]